MVHCTRGQPKPHQMVNSSWPGWSNGGWKNLSKVRQSIGSFCSWHKVSLDLQYEEAIWSVARGRTDTAVLNFAIMDLRFDTAQARVFFKVWKEDRKDPAPATHWCPTLEALADCLGREHGDAGGGTPPTSRSSASQEKRARKKAKKMAN